MKPIARRLCCLAWALILGDLFAEPPARTGPAQSVEQSNDGDGNCRVNVNDAQGPVTITCENPSVFQNFYRNVIGSARFKRTLLYPGAHHFQRNEPTVGWAIFSSFTALVPYQLYQQQRFLRANDRIFNEQARAYLYAGLFHPAGIALYNNYRSRWISARDDAAAQIDLSALLLITIYLGNFLLGLWDEAPPPRAPAPISAPPENAATNLAANLARLSEPQLSAEYSLSVDW